jgi:uncharacterized membrane protein YcaP (DUF421 family)
MSISVVSMLDILVAVFLSYKIVQQIFRHEVQELDVLASWTLIFLGALVLLRLAGKAFWDLCLVEQAPEPLLEQSHDRNNVTTSL